MPRSIGKGRSFHEGYAFLGDENIRIVRSDVKAAFSGTGREPAGCALRFADENGNNQRFRCTVIRCVPLPVPGATVYETTARIEWNGRIGYGLLEHLVHERSPLHYARAMASIQRMRWRARR